MSSLMKPVLVALMVSCVLAIMSVPVKKEDLVRRQATTGPDGVLGCLQIEKSPGQYEYRAPEGEEAGVCGLYLIGDVDTVVEMQFPQFHVDCKDGGLVALVDGWELNGEFFPSILDHPDDFEARYKTFCGEDRPASVYVARQNVALIQFYVTRPGQGFKVNVRFLPNPQPCNIVTRTNEGVVTLRNFGVRRNCTVSMIYPESLLLLDVDVGVTSTAGPALELETGLSLKCSGPGGPDYVEFVYGSGLDTALMARHMAFCGLRSKAARRSIVLGCQNSAVRLVSSGLYYNSVTFRHSSPNPRDLERFDPSLC